jgi:phosphoribosylanthranilate isomerase
MNLPKNGVAKEIRHYIGALLIFFFIVALVIGFIQFPVLDSNKEVVMMLVGTLSASLAMVVSTITGSKPDDIEAMKNKVEKLELTIEQLHKNKDEYEKMIINLQNQMVENYDNILDRVILKSAMDFDDKKRL